MNANPAAITLAWRYAEIARQTGPTLATQEIMQRIIRVAGYPLPEKIRDVMAGRVAP